MIIACIGGGSNAAGIFSAFIDDADVALIGVEAAGFGIPTGKHAASICAGMVGILHGNKTYLLQDEDGQIKNAHSLAPGARLPRSRPSAFYVG